MELPILIFPNSEEAEGHGFNYNEWDKIPSAVRAVQAVIVKNGTQDGNATVDLILEDTAGNKHVLMITACLLASVVFIAQQK